MSYYRDFSPTIPYFISQRESSLNPCRPASSLPCDRKGEWVEGLFSPAIASSCHPFRATLVSRWVLPDSAGSSPSQREQGRQRSGQRAKRYQRNSAPLLRQPL